MHEKILLLALFLLFAITGCSGNTPVTPISTGEPLDSIPIIGLTDTDGTFNVIGLLGAYELIANPERMTYELVSKRISAIGEDYIVSGVGFFTVSPCASCLQINSIGLNGSDVILKFGIEHPFDPGDPVLPPTAINRLDLDVFDLALVVVPVDSTPATDYSLNNTDIYTGICGNVDGYTTELSKVIDDEAALPYILIIDESGETSHTWNEFAMGDSTEFDVVFTFTPGDTLSFDLYLTMGYGAGAIQAQRLEPKYYNPEFNRKAAWKVEAVAQGPWFDNDDSSAVDVEVRVYDWQIGATVYPVPDDFENAPVDNVYAASEVESVSVEIPGMNSILPSVTTPESGTGMPNAPLIFSVPVANENLISAGLYTGLVKVTDERECLTSAHGRDYLIDAPDGITLTYYSMPEYATYQTFTASVEHGCNGFCWAKTWGGLNKDYGYSVAADNDGNVYVTGRFNTEADFNPDGGGSQSSNGGDDAYLSMFTSDGIWNWTITWGGSSSDAGGSVTKDQDGYVYVTGAFQSSVDFNPAGGDTHDSHGGNDVFLSKYDSSGNWYWTKTWGGGSHDYGSSVAADQSGNLYVSGYFNGTVEFNPDGGDPQSANGDRSDVFFSKFDTDGNWQYSRTWGSTNHDYGRSIALDNLGGVYISGDFWNTVDFDPGPDDHSQSTNGMWPDVYLSKFDTDGIWQWTQTWGGGDDEYGSGIAAGSNGYVYVTGEYWGTIDLNPAGGDPHGCSGNYDVYLNKLDSNGVWQWGKTWGAGGWDESSCVTMDEDYNVYIIGAFEGTVDFNPEGGGSQSSGGYNDPYVSKFNSSDDWVWTKAWGGGGDNIGKSVDVDQYGNVYVTGFFEDTADFNPEEGDSQSSNGATDVFLSRFHY